MEYITKEGVRVIVDGDKMQYGQDKMRKKIIGANFVNGGVFGGYLSSFNGPFNEELICIESGLGDHVDATIGDIKDAYELLKSKISNADVTDIFELSSLVLETVDEYFNGFNNISDRMKFYYPEDYEESKNNKISNLKGTGAAMCVERSALAQNLLKSLGINSYFKTSGIIKNNKKEAHSYNLIEFNNKYYIFDTSMPNLINDKINPLIAEIDKETFDLISAPIASLGISITVSHYNPYWDSDATITYDSGREKQIKVEPIGKNNKKYLQ